MTSFCETAPASLDAGRNVVFLDVDGVLCCERSLLTDYEPNEPSLYHDQDGKIDYPLERSCIRRLRRILEEGDASLVISSTWRSQVDMRRFLLRALHDEGIDVEKRVLGDTADLACLRLARDPVFRTTGGGRGAEVLAWLNKQDPPVPAFVILDDSHEESFRKAGLRNQLILTFMKDGLTEDLATNAIEVLRSGRISEQQSNLDSVIRQPPIPEEDECREQIMGHQV